MRLPISLAAALAVLAGAAEVHVSPNGDDAADGTAARPVRTLARARDLAVRQGGPVVVADGYYELEHPLELGSAHQGLVFAAAPGARPIVSAGRRVRDWSVDGKGWWHAQVAAGTRSSQFYVNGQRRTRPFLPRQGYHFIASEAPKSPEGLQQFVAFPNAFDRAWTDLGEIEVCIFNNWNLARLPVKSVDFDTGLVTLDAPFKEKKCYYALAPENWYRLDNVRAALGEPGDWHLGRNGDLVYVPRPGEDPRTADCVLANLDCAVRAVGAADVTFRGITFAHANWNMPATGYHHAQACADLHGAIDVEHSRNVRLERCAVIHTGAYAVAFGDGAKDCAAVDCEFVDLGAGGVKIGCEWATGNDPKNFGSGCVVENCLVRGGGRVDPAGAGVFLGHAFNCRVAHNTIHDLHYSGVSLGWNWGFAETAHDNVIEWNHIFHIGKRVLSDMGGIYALGRQRGTVERYNHIHDVTRARYGAFGIYFDSGSSLITVTNNLVHDVQDCGLYLQTLSASNVVENNVFACNPNFQLQIPPRDKGAQPSRFARNLLWWDEGRLFLSVPDEKTIAFADNLYWNVGDGEAPEGGVRGFTRRDPCFADPAKRDFRLLDEAAARSVGFVPFSVAAAGRRGGAVLTADLPSVPDVYFPAPEKPPTPCREDFEKAAGIGWPGWTCMPDNPASYAQVTTATAAEGAHALEVTDVQADWMPHFCAWPDRRKGTVAASFALRLGEGAATQFEIRDREGWCGTPGPWVWFDGQGRVHGRGGKVLTTVPHDTWIRVELSFEVGKGRKEDVYSVRIQVPGEAAPRVFGGLPVHKRFRSVGWVGFVSVGAVGSKYWIDDFRLGD